MFAFGGSPAAVLERAIAFDVLFGAILAVGSAATVPKEERVSLLVIAPFVILMFVVIAGVRAAYWWWRYGDARYEFRHTELVVVRGRAVTRTWSRDSVYYMRVEGLGVSWRGLFTNTAELPRFVVRTVEHDLEKGPAVLYWGYQRSEALEDHPRAWCRS